MTQNHIDVEACTLIALREAGRVRAGMLECLWSVKFEVEQTNFKSTVQAFKMFLVEDEPNPLLTTTVKEQSLVQAVNSVLAMLRRETTAELKTKSDQALVDKCKLSLTSTSLVGMARLHNENYLHALSDNFEAVTQPWVHLYIKGALPSAPALKSNRKPVR